jgi:putative membrane protein
VWLWFGFGFAGGWLHAKTALVVLLLPIMRIVVACCRPSGPGATRTVTSGIRWFNEMPVLVLLAVTYLAVVKPF